MDKHAAEKILLVALDCSRRADQSVARVRDECDERVLQSYRRYAGRIMGHIFTEILAPLWEEHGDLAPAWYRERREKGASSDPKMAKALRDELLRMLSDFEQSLSATATIADDGCTEEAAHRYRRGLGEILAQVTEAKKYLLSLAADDGAP